MLLENAEPGIRDSLPEGDADRLLRLLREGSLLELFAFASSRRSGVGGSLERKALEELAARHGIDATDVDKAWELLRTGSFVNDLSGVTAVSVDALGSMPGALAKFVRDPKVAVDVIPAGNTASISCDRAIHWG